MKRFLIALILAAVPLFAQDFGPLKFYTTWIDQDVCDVILARMPGICRTNIMITSNSNNADVRAFEVTVVYEADGKTFSDTLISRSQLRQRVDENGTQVNYAAGWTFFYPSAKRFTIKSVSVWALSGVSYSESR